MLWYVRESSVAVWVTNLPLIWPLLRDIFPTLRSFTPGQRVYSGSKLRSRCDANSTVPRGTFNSPKGNGLDTGTHISVLERSYQMDTLRSKRAGDSASLDSDERRLNGPFAMGYMGGISTETTVEVEQRSLRPMEGEGGVPAGGGNGWDGDHDKHGYQVRIRGGDASRGDSIATHDDGPVEPQDMNERTT